MRTILLLCVGLLSGCADWNEYGPHGWAYEQTPKANYCRSLCGGVSTDCMAYSVCQ